MKLLKSNIRNLCGNKKSVQPETPDAESNSQADLLFYHVRLHCYVVVELKTEKFKPEFASKLNFYVMAVNKQMKTEKDNPTIGILICKMLLLNSQRKSDAKAYYEGVTVLPVEWAYMNSRLIVRPDEEWDISSKFSFRF